MSIQTETVNMSEYILNANQNSRRMKNMKTYDEKIKDRQLAIKKFQTEIDNRKAKIAKLNAEIKELQDAQAGELGKDIMQKLVSLGLESEADRKAILEKIENLAIERGIEKSEKIAQTETPTSEENSKTEPSPAAPVFQNSQNSQNPSAPKFNEKSNF